MTCRLQRAGLLSTAFDCYATPCAVSVWVAFCTSKSGKSSLSLFDLLHSFRRFYRQNDALISISYYQALYEVLQNSFCSSACFCTWYFSALSSDTQSKGSFKDKPHQLRIFPDPSIHPSIHPSIRPLTHSESCFVIYTYRTPIFFRVTRISLSITRMVTQSI
jgi:hypothetical protein